MNVLSQLPRSNYFPSQESDHKAKELNTNEHQCVICMTDYEAGDEILTLTCFHKFHSVCVETWFTKQDWCPVCRNKINAC